MTSRVLGLIFSCLLSSVLTAQIAPLKPGKLSSTVLLGVTRLSSDDELNNPHKSPDGLLFCFAVSPNPPAEHQFGIKQSKDFKVDGRSYQAITQKSQGRLFVPVLVAHDPKKYAAENTIYADAISKVSPESSIITMAIGGAHLKESEDVEIVFHIGFGRTPEKIEAEDLVFRTKVPSLPSPSKH
jgi:hypothetical protein